MYIIRFDHELPQGCITGAIATVAGGKLAQKADIRRGMH